MRACPKCHEASVADDGYCGGRCREITMPSFAAPPCSPSGVELEVCHDIAVRQEKGIAKYGVTVASNPLDLKAWLQHAYEETLDQAIYLKRAIREMENHDSTTNR